MEYREIDINKITPNPNNPRKTFPDLTDLTESIRENGILQPLTVVPILPKTDEYRVVIGHCRYKAARAAGLETVPCFVRQWDQKKQVEIMLTENVQRNDLTIAEEAQGYQMMLDLGATVDEVAKKIGKSASYIRRRTRLLCYDPDALAQSIERGARMEDYEKLEKIKDADKRAELLAEIGTNNFGWKYSAALRDQAEAEKVEKILEILKAGGIKPKETTTEPKIYSYNIITPEDAEEYIDNKADDQELYYEPGYNSVFIYTPLTDEDKAEEAAEERRDEAERERRARLEHLNKQAYGLRLQYIAALTNADCKTLSAAINNMELFVLACAPGLFDDDTFNALFPPEKGAEPNVTFERVNDEANAAGVSPERMRLILSYCRMDSASRVMYDWMGNYRKNERLERLYFFLGCLGYDISDEETAMLDGTHEAYKKAD